MPEILASCASSKCAAQANHGIVSSHGGRVFVIGRLCEGFACMLELVTRVSVVKDFGVGGRRTDRMGSTALAWDVDCQLDRRLWRASAPCFWLVSNSWTWQKGRGDIDTFRPSRRQTETNRSQGTTSWKTLDGQRLQKKNAVPDVLGQVSSSFWV